MNYIFVHEKTLDEYNKRSNRGNTIRRFRSDIFKKIPTELIHESKQSFFNLVPYTKEIDIKGATPYWFKPESENNKIKEFFEKFIVFVEVPNPEWEQKKKVWKEAVYK